MRSHLVVALAVVLVVLGTGFGDRDVQASDETVLMGAVGGTVLDRETNVPLPGANVVVVGTPLGTTADTLGRFQIKRVPVGAYTLAFSYIGYEPLYKVDVIVKSKRTVFVEVELKAVPIEFEALTVTPGYFEEVRDEPVHTVEFSSEEIRRAPGSAGDVSRIISGLPSIAKVNDQSNGLAVRGGSTMENGFYLDNIEIPNINHFPSQGASGGPIGMLNVDFLRDVRFYPGGFSAAYGDRLSSVMDLTFREGNRYERDGKLDLSFGGAGLVAEGPLEGERGSWLFSARRSFLDLLVGAIGTGVVPKYGDLQAKVVYDVSPQHKLSFIDVSGRDRIGWTQDQARDDGNNLFGTFRAVTNTAGVNWSAIWGKSGFSQTSLSHTYTKFRWDYQETVSGRDLWKSTSPEQAVQFRNVNTYRINSGNRLEFGVEAKHLMHDYDYFWGEYTDPFGQKTPALTVKDRIRAQKVGAFASYTWDPVRALSMTLGMRGDYFSYNENAHLSPRGSLTCRLTERTSLNGTFGAFYQNLPLVILSQNASNRDLKDPVAYHATLGFSHLLTDDTRLTVEAYAKDYRNFPMDPSQPSLFILDEFTYRGVFFNHEALVDRGKARSMGIEMLIQKKLAENVYGLISGGYSRMRYRGLDGVWRDRVYDNRYLFSAEGGYKPNRNWEFSLRWIYAGGVPYTPFDLEASHALNRGVIDRNDVNGARYPAYHSLNVRFDRRFHFSGSNMVAYVSVWNAYNRKNIAEYYWNETENKPDEVVQWNMIPMFGIEYDF